MPTAMVLCAGLGTRLRPLTDEIPKPLMPIGDRSALAHVLGALKAAGIARAVVNTHHLARDFTQELAKLPLDVHVSHEPSVLGTAGGIANAASLLGEGEVVVWNGDIHAPSLGIAALLEAHRRSRAEATWVVSSRARGEGTVGLDEAGQVVRLRGRVFGEERRGGDFLGVSVFSPALRATLPREGCLVGDVALPLLAQGGRIASFVFDGEWHDIGTPQALLDANLAWLSREGRDAHRAASSRIADGISLDQAVVSAGASVTGEGSLHRVLVLPGARAVAPLEDAVVGATAVVASLTGRGLRS